MLVHTCTYTHTHTHSLTHTLTHTHTHTHTQETRGKKLIRIRGTDKWLEVERVCLSMEEPSPGVEDGFRIIEHQAP